jgi:hypothetical protein
MMRSVNQDTRGEFMIRVPVRRAIALSVLIALGSFSSAAASSPAHLVPSGAPQQLVIGKIGVRASIESSALNKPADVMAPFRWGDVVWYNRGPRPGEQGRAQIYGHLDSTCCPAVFWRLKDMHQGDLVAVDYPGGHLTFKVQWQATYLNSKVPDSFFYGRTTDRGILLVTCAGIFHHDGTGYDHKLVVYATLVPSAGHS